MNNPIHYLSVAIAQDDGAPFEIGWYFWDETWTYRYGPYATQGEAQAALESYVAENLGGSA